MTIFAPDERLPSSATLAMVMMVVTCILLLVRTMRMTVELPTTAVKEIAQ